jgi:phage terminase large subunit-like protein
MSWDLSCRDWEQRIAQGRSLVPELPLNQAEADRAVAIYNRLRLPDVPGLPTLGEAAGDWFRAIVAALFGSLDANGVRLIRELFLLVPKKNSKTTNSAALMLTAALMTRRPRALFLLIGPTQSVADLAFEQALGMIQADPELDGRVHIQEHLKRITIKATGARLQIKTFDTKILTGVKPIGTLVDEVHLLGEIPNADRVIGQLRGGMLPFPEAFLAFITTQSERPPAGAFRAELMKARAIRAGQMSGAMLPVLYEMPARLLRNNAWRDPAQWWMVNPNRDRSVTIARLEEDYAKAVTTGEEEVRRWASQHLNIEIGLALRSDRWAGADHWEAAVELHLTDLDALLDRSEVATVGIDGGGLDDLLGLAVIGRERGTRRWLLWTHCWAHEMVLERHKGTADRLRDFEVAGDLTIVKLLGEDVTEIADTVERVAASGLLPDKNAIGLDPVGIGQIVDELGAREISAERIVGISQGWKLSGAIKTTERGLADGTLVHGGQALMAWAVGNAKVEPRGNAVTITKQASGSAKIDPLMAAFNAVSLMSMNPEASGRSVYERHGLIVL